MAEPVGKWQTMAEPVEASLVSNRGLTSSGSARRDLLSCASPSCPRPVGSWELAESAGHRRIQWLSGQHGVMSGLLEVVVLTEMDARRAEEGGADRLMLVGGLTGQGTSPEPGAFARVQQACTLPVRPLLRLRDGYRTDGGEVTRLHGLITSYLADGADGVVLGFLDGYSQVDVEVVTELTDDGAFAWTFDHAIDRCLDIDDAWQTLKPMRGLDQVLTAGSSRGLGEGLDDLIVRAKSDPDAAGLMMAGGGLVPEHVAWLSRVGVRAFQVGPQVRPGGVFSSDVDASLVRAWRILLDTFPGRDAR